MSRLRSDRGCLIEGTAGAASSKNLQATRLIVLPLVLLLYVVLPLLFGCVESAGAEAQQTQLEGSAQVPQSMGTISVEEAINRAKANQPAFATAVAANRVAALDHSIARSALLPSVVYHNQYLYTEPAHGVTQSGNASTAATTSIPRFIGNNSVHEYTSQGVVTETIGVQQLTAVARASAAKAVAAAELEIARRGLVVTVVGLYYNSLAADHKKAIAGRALDEARNFLKLTQQREEAREAAHADVVKAQLIELQRERESADTQLQVEKAHLELGVLLFPDPATSFLLNNFSAPAPAAVPPGTGSGSIPEQRRVEECAGVTACGQPGCDGSPRGLPA